MAKAADALGAEIDNLPNSERGLNVEVWHVDSLTRGADVEVSPAVF